MIIEYSNIVLFLLNKGGIIILMNDLDKLAKKHGIKFIALYGSFVHKKKEPSDIDIALIFNDEKKVLTIDEYSELTRFFSVYFKQPFNEIDIVVLNKMSSPVLRYQATKEPKLIYGNEKEFLTWRAMILKIYMDTKRFRDLTDKYINSKISKISKVYV